MFPLSVAKWKVPEFNDLEDENPFIESWGTVSEDAAEWLTYDNETMTFFFEPPEEAEG